MRERSVIEELKKNFETERQKYQNDKTEIKRKTDEEIKETRIEMEGKLEKMKEKMVS